MPADKSTARRTASNHRETHPRLGPADPRTRVAPARPDPIHRAIVITALTFMLAAAVVALAFSLRSSDAPASVVRGVTAVTVAGVAVLTVSEWYFRIGRRR